MLESPESPTAGAAVLTTTQWQARALTHVDRVQRFTRPRRERRARRETHPVYDFLFTYYSYSGGKLETWHPDPHELLVDSDEARARFIGPAYHAVNGLIQRNASALSSADRKTLNGVLHILSATRERSANFGCYGIHEWAMVYGGHDVRHAEIAPLRLPQAQVDAFVESRPVACSHFDAFRFFAPAAQPMNRVALEWSTRHEAEQPGCIHANMDLYRWAYTSMPWIGSELLWDCFELAVGLRVLDMQAGPYDLSGLGFEPVCVETVEGRDQYQRRQREMSACASMLRARLIDTVGAILDRRAE
ncbi:MAG: 3-methyladenine DNA glycosylase [Gemmatimonadaceae bacterium]